MSHCQLFSFVKIKYPSDFKCYYLIKDMYIVHGKPKKSVILVDNPSEREREKVGVEKWLKNYLEVEDVCYIGRTNT